MAAEHTRAIAEGIYANMPTTAVEIIASAIEEAVAETERRLVWDRDDASWEVLQRTDERYRRARDARREALRVAGVADG